ncbi:hypothetical protein SK128_001559 [Halocaridina rubra]|uniref:Acylphosphatase-like domain-containing protein n=1 Tax=Halocaridina rubra TaxID=373956 RepID=A0AAN8XKE0_HALRR
MEGCNFIKVAKDNADRLGITGWIKNNKTGTVGGRLQGAKANVDEIQKRFVALQSRTCSLTQLYIIYTFNSEVFLTTHESNFGHYYMFLIVNRIILYVFMTLNSKI